MKINIWNALLTILFVGIMAFRTTMDAPFNWGDAFLFSVIFLINTAYSSILDEYGKMIRGINQKYIEALSTLLVIEDKVSPDQRPIVTREIQNFYNMIKP